MMDDVIIALVAAAAVDAGIPPRLALAVVQVESNGNPKAVSPAGAKGLFQLMPSTGARYGLQTDEDFLNPAKNARAGCLLLRDLRDEMDTWWRALAAYVWGAGNVNRTPNFYEWPPAVRRYIERVWRLWQGPKKASVPVDVKKNVNPGILLSGS